jgi:hypothetical protein
MTRKIAPADRDRARLLRSDPQPSLPVHAFVHVAKAMRLLRVPPRPRAIAVNLRLLILCRTVV